MTEGQHLPSTARLTNVALADPGHFKLVGNYVSKKAAPTDPARMFIVGTVAHCNLWSDRGAKQICVCPSDVIWPCAAAVLYSVQGTTAVNGKQEFGMSTYKCGCS